MAIRNIRYDGDDILRKVCRPVEKMDDRTLTLIVVIDVGDDNPLCLINPVITESDGEQTGEEGCLSLPGKFGTVTRPMHVICKAFDENMEEFTVEGEGLLARAICHELDHLDGKLYKDLVEDGLHEVEQN